MRALSYLFISILTISSKLSSNEMEFYKKQADSFGNQEITRAFSEAKNFKAQEDIDSDALKKMVGKGSRNNSEVDDFLTSKELEENRLKNKSFDEGEFFIRRSEEVSQNPFQVISHTKSDVEDETDLKKCKSSGSPFTLVVFRDLLVEVNLTHEKKTKTKFCLGHSSENKHRKKGSAQDDYDRQREQFKKDITIDKWDISIHKGPTKSSVRSKWTHKNNTEGCNHFRVEEVTIQKEKKEISKEKWVPSSKEDLDLASSEKCTQVSYECLDDTNQVIDGLSISKKCWKEKLSFLCEHKNFDDCEFLKAKNCQLYSQKCLKEVNGSCALWEKTFRCFKPTQTKITSDGTSIYCLDGNCVDKKAEENETFGEVTTKLAVFEEMKKDLLDSSLDDASKIKFFSGEEFSCKKDTVGKALSDCCFSNKGMAMDIGLRRNCPPDAIVLGEKRENGQCHYIGEFKKKEMGISLFVSHVFCCFSSKLSRVFQEEARKQLGISWGSAKSPSCGGLSQSQISSLNFNSLDLSPAFEDQFKKIADLEKKKDSLSKRIKSLGESHENNQEKVL
jgi:conjugal transfer mating pair stabilization protein TraN